MLFFTRFFSLSIIFPFLKSDIDYFNFLNVKQQKLYHDSTILLTRNGRQYDSVNKYSVLEYDLTAISM